MSTMISGYTLIQPESQLDPQMMSEWRGFLEELSNITASTDIDLGASPCNLDPGHMRAKIEGLIESSTQKRVQPGNYEVAYHYILDEV